MTQLYTNNLVDPTTAGKALVSGANVKEMTVFPELAQQWLSEFLFHGQRSVRKDHVVYLAEQMSRGEFLPLTTIVFVSVDNHLYLVDGQHRLMAVVRSGLPQRFIVVTRQARDRDEVGMIYGLTDINLRRTISDLTSAMALDMETGLSRTQLNELGIAVGFIQNDFQRTKKIKGLDRGALVQQIREYAQYAEQFYEVVAGCNGAVRHALGRSATLSVALITYRYSIKKFNQSVDDFWQGATFDDGLRARDPRKFAHQHLLLTTMPTGGYRVVKRAGQIMGANESARYLATCFNKFIEGVDVSLVRSSKEVPIAGSEIVIR